MTWYSSSTDQQRWVDWLARKHYHYRIAVHHYGSIVAVDGGHEQWLDILFTPDGSFNGCIYQLRHWLTLFPVMLSLRLWS